MWNGTIASFRYSFRRLAFSWSVLLLVLTLLLASCAPVTVQPRVASEPASLLIGEDTLASQHPLFRADQAIKFFRLGTPLSTLDTTFGEDYAKVARLISGIRPVYFRFHLINYTCIRNNNCGRYEPGSGYSPARFDQALQSGNPELKRYVQSHTKRYCEMSKSLPQTIFLGSPLLEGEVSQESWNNIADWMLGACPGLQLVFSSTPTRPARSYKGAWLEMHGKPARGFPIVSTDGLDAMDMDLVGQINRYNNSKIYFKWTRSYNCRDQADHFTDPRARKACPKAYQFEETHHASDRMPPAPPFTGKQCRKIQPFAAPEIWKPLAEDNGTGDVRANLPVLISNLRPNAAKALSSHGAEVATLPYYGKFVDGQNRFYSGTGSKKNGYQIQKEAGGYVWLISNGTCHGPLIPGRRQGSQR